MDRITAMEKEKTELCSQSQKIVSATEEAASYKRKLSEMREMLEAKEKALENERSDKESIEHSQDELLTKMKELQKENDHLVIKLEGLKTENEGLLSKNKKLEGRVKELEVQNKQQLHQLNETLKMPTPISSDRGEISSVKSSAIEIPRSVASSIRMSSSPPSLSIPIIIQDEKRPALLEKDLKVIPVIVEPSHTSASVSFDMDSMSKLQLTSKESTILEDSTVQSDNKAFADAFSRSGEKFSTPKRFQAENFFPSHVPVSKDDQAPSIEDDFDPKTFSIDQVSDAEGVSELIEDEEDYEYLFDAGKF